jgi:hypothetical protein
MVTSVPRQPASSQNRNPSRPDGVGTPVRGRRGDAALLAPQPAPSAENMVPVE